MALCTISDLLVVTAEFELVELVYPLSRELRGPPGDYFSMAGPTTGGLPSSRRPVVPSSVVTSSYSIFLLTLPIPCAYSLFLFHLPITLDFWRRSPIIPPILPLALRGLVALLLGDFWENF